MSFLVGQTKQLPTSNAATTGAQQSLMQYLMQQHGGFNQLTPGTTVDQASIQPYLDLFTQQNSRNFAQAKESAGNLTGSSLGSIIGAEAGRADVEQGAFLANLFEQRRQQDANRYMQTLLGGMGSPAGQVQNVYQPGFLDYLFQGAGAAAPFIAPGLAKGATKMPGGQ